MIEKNQNPFSRKKENQNRKSWEVLTKNPIEKKRYQKNRIEIEKIGKFQEKIRSKKIDSRKIESNSKKSGSFKKNSTKNRRKESKLIGKTSFDGETKTTKKERLFPPATTRKSQK